MVIMTKKIFKIANLDGNVTFFEKNKVKKAVKA